MVKMIDALYGTSILKNITEPYTKLPIKIKLIKDKVNTDDK